MGQVTTRVIIRRPGGRERLEFEQAPLPSPGPGCVRVRVHAIGVNYADCVVRMGLYAAAKKYVGWPITPGFEVAGVVDAVGEGVTSRAPGDRVFAVTRFGGYADTLIAPEHQVFAMPGGLDYASAAALPSVFLTAWYAIERLACPGPGARVLVHSAAGGVGGCLVQLARRRGCEVVGVVGASHKVAAVRAAGATAIDKSTADLWSAARDHAPDGYDVILDANGVETLRASYEHLAKAGRLVIYGFHTMLPRDGRVRPLKLVWHWLRTPRFNPLLLTQENRSVMGFNLAFMFDRREVLAAGVADMVSMLTNGEFRTPAITTYPLSEVARAHRDLESGQTVGKLVLVP